MRSLICGYNYVRTTDAKCLGRLGLEGAIGEGRYRGYDGIALRGSGPSTGSIRGVLTPGLTTVLAISVAKGCFEHTGLTAGADGLTDHYGHHENP